MKNCIKCIQIVGQHLWNSNYSMEKQAFNSMDIRIDETWRDDSNFDIKLSSFVFWLQAHFLSKAQVGTSLINFWLCIYELAKRIKQQTIVQWKSKANAIVPDITVSIYWIDRIFIKSTDNHNKLMMIYMTCILFARF